MYIRLTFDGRSEPHPLPLLQCKPILKKANKVIDDLLHLRGIFLDHLKQLGKNFAVFIVGADLRVCPDDFCPLTYGSLPAPAWLITRSGTEEVGARLYW
jgi:hypothetical protein